MQLVVENLAKSFGVQEIFKNISFMVDKGEKIGLVGVNGCGKSTLVHCLLQPEFADQGTIHFEPGLQLGYVEQGFGSIREEDIWSFMLRANPEILQLRDQLKKLEGEAGKADQGVLESYGRVTQRYEYLDGYNYELHLKRVLLGLSFPQEMWEQNAQSLSGGQKTRLMLAAALVKSPDFLILDEPTNHLDIKMMEWLESYLRDYKGGLIIVSHDRTFLDNVTTRILEMEGGHLQSFKGNYSKYLEQKEIQSKTQTAAYEAQQDYIAMQEAYIRRFKAGIKSKMARGRQSQLDRLERLDAPVQNETFSLRLPKAPESAEKVLILEDVKIGYGNRVLAQKVNLTLRQGEKVGLIGANGTGKTTLLKSILGEIPLLGGKTKLGNRVQVGYFSQSYERLNPAQTLMENFLTEYGLTDEQTRSLLGGMLFHGDDVFKSIGSLSGGQKARLVLLKLVLDGANFLILDEPTNHLDILAKETVEAALETFNGSVLLVSHDRYLVNEIASRIWEIDEGQIKDYKGNFEFYRAERARLAVLTVQEGGKVSTIDSTGGKTRFGACGDLEVKSGQNPEISGGQEKGRELAAVDGGAGKNNKNKHKNLSPRHSPEELKNLIAKVELSLREQEAMLGVLDKEICKPENQIDPENSFRLARERETYEQTINDLMNRWEVLLEEADSLEE